LASQADVGVTHGSDVRACLHATVATKIAPTY